MMMPEHPGFSTEGLYASIKDKMNKQTVKLMHCYLGMT